MKILKKLLISLIITSNVYAGDGLIWIYPDTKDEVVSLHKNDKSPYDGVLFPLDKAKELQTAVLERDNYKLLNESLQKSLDLDKDTEKVLNQKVELITQQNNNLSETLYKTRETTAWDHFWWFLLGVVSTTAAVYGASRLGK